MELNAHVRKGETCSLVVYASKITRTEKDDATGEESERDIPFLKGYTVFNVERLSDRVRDGGDCLHIADKQRKQNAS